MGAQSRFIEATPVLPQVDVSYNGFRKTLATERNAGSDSEYDIPQEQFASKCVKRKEKQHKSSRSGKLWNGIIPRRVFKITYYTVLVIFGHPNCSRDDASRPERFLKIGTTSSRQCLQIGQRNRRQNTLLDLLPARILGDGH